MGILGERRSSDDETGSGDSSPWVDLGLRACPTCQRELMAWEERCPADDSVGVALSQTKSQGVPPVPAHLLDDEEDL